MAGVVGLSAFDAGAAVLGPATGFRWTAAVLLIAFVPGFVPSGTTFWTTPLTPRLAASAYYGGLGVALVGLLAATALGSAWPDVVAAAAIVVGGVLTVTRGRSQRPRGEERREPR